MSRGWQRTLRKRFCRRQASYLWTKRRIITPALLPIVWGDGRQIIALRPIITRVSHYIVAVDSSLQLHKGDLHDFTDEIYVEMEDHFGECGCENCAGDYGKPWPFMFKQWPTPCFNGGCEWWKLAILGRAARLAEAA